MLNTRSAEDLRAAIQILARNDRNDSDVLRDVGALLASRPLGCDDPQDTLDMLAVIVGGECIEDN